MKRFLFIGVIAAMILPAGVALAADSNTLTVSANVVGTCKFSSPTSTLAFGALDPSSTVSATASTTTSFWCTKGATVGAPSYGNGLHYSGGTRMQHATVLTEFIPYSLTLTPSAATGAGPASPLTLTIDGTIQNANFINAAAGNYSDTVVIAINP